MELHREVLAVAWALSAAGHTLHHSDAHQLLWWATPHWIRVEIKLVPCVRRELVVGDWQWSEIELWELRAWSDDILIHATVPTGHLGAALETLGATEGAR